MIIDEDYEGAIADYTRAIESAPREWPRLSGAYANRGIARYRLDQFRSAMTDLEQASRIDPQNALAFYYRGAAYEALNLLEDAVREYLKAGSLSENADCCTALGRVQAKRGYLEDALARFREALALDPHQWESALGLGRALTESKEREEADLGLLLKAYPACDDQKAREELADLLQRLGVDLPESDD